MDWLYLIRYLAAFGFMVGLLGVFAWAVRVYGPKWGLVSGVSGTATRRMKRLESLSLSPRHAVHLVEVDGLGYVVGTSPEGTSVTPLDRAHPLPAQPKKKS